ncbi:spheroidene monooxygenase [Catalinimonas niigatensis]|uniref:spheroidene monooxygenase n=1 Tax=Catalinimonas niigatensis TaxID=1397264 RepID=UPI0026670780|nr:spheroidene monooxygenase [Catalinimonas niigatensis]WPP51631.1 spheroidene monooxygenase [Catalinimonas niigatensis]
MRGQVATISFFYYQGRQKWWAFRQMKSALPKLNKIEDLQFFKMLGSGGGNGFSILPDLSIYAVLCVWKSLGAAEDILNKDASFCTMKLRASHYLHVYMKATRSKGAWSGKKPFDEFAEYQEEAPIAVLTRASIAPNKLFSFWKNVPKVSQKLQAYDEGLIFSKGIGELPVIQQATFSIWQSRKKMVEYAYQGKKHQEMIRKTKELQWYTEEMFVEFILLKIDHQWPGFNFKGNAKVVHTK